MPSNQRINERKARKRKNEQKLRRIVWGIIIGVAALLIVMKVLEIDMSSVKNKVVGSDGKLSVATQQDAYPYPLDSSKNVKVAVQNDKLNILTGVSVTVLNPTDAKPVYSFNHGYANPIIKSAGSYFCLIDQGSNRFRLDSLSENIYETDTETAILTANVSKNGNVIYATKSKDAKSTVTVINSKLKKLASFEVNSGYVIATAIDSTGKKCAYAVVNSKNAKLITTVYTFNIGDKKERAAIQIDTGNLLDLHYCSNDFYIVMSDSLYTVSSQKKKHEVFKDGNVNTVCYNYTSNDEIVYVYSKYASANENVLVYVNSSGKIKTSVKLKQRAKAVSSVSNEISVLFSDKIITYSLTKGDVKKTYKCDDYVTGVNKLSTKLFISRNQQIDVME